MNLYAVNGRLPGSFRTKTRAQPHSGATDFVSAGRLDRSGESTLQAK